MATYTLIFVFKIIEDSLATLRLILVSNGKKVMGAILQFIVTIIWIWLTGSILIDFMNDGYKVWAFALGSLLGSYIGSLIEEKLALGTNCFTVKSDLICEISKVVNNSHFIINDKVMMIIAPRKNSNKIIKKIKSIDNEAYIILEKVKTTQYNRK